MYPTKAMPSAGASIAVTSVDPTSREAGHRRAAGNRTDETYALVGQVEDRRGCGRAEHSEECNWRPGGHGGDDQHRRQGRQAQGRRRPVDLVEPAQHLTQLIDESIRVLGDPEQLRCEATMIAAIPARYPTRTGRDRRSASAPSRNTQPKMQNPKTRIASAAAEELAPPRPGQGRQRGRRHQRRGRLRTDGQLTRGPQKRIQGQRADRRPEACFAPELPPVRRRPSPEAPGTP